MSVLIDQFQRRIRYLRLSVTDQCDLRCGYCLPKGFKDFVEPDDWLNFDEIHRVIKLFTQLGVDSIRLTGGEPLLRKNLPLLAERLVQLPELKDLAISTNAVRLTKLAEPLRNAGIKRVNISLDSLDPERFRSISQGKLEKVLAGLQAAKAAGFAPIKINMVLMAGINDDEAEDILAFCIHHGFTLRFIEIMPIGDTGRLSSKHYISLQTIKARLARRFSLIPEVPSGHHHDPGPAHYMRVGDTGARVGFITPMSEHFCADCNRIRLTADGTLYPCLGQNNAIPLGHMLRNGASDTDLLNAIANAIHFKPERHEFNEKPQQVLRFMSMTGG